MAKMMLPISFGALAIFLLFFKLPAVAESVGFLHCSICITKTPWIPILGASYFAAFIAVILCFPLLPKKWLKICGMGWSVLLALFLFYLEPSLCYLCVAAHVCHLCMWVFWKPRYESPTLSFGIRLLLTLLAAISLGALFSTFNFTFLLY